MSLSGGVSWLGVSDTVRNIQSKSQIVAINTPAELRARARGWVVGRGWRWGAYTAVWGASVASAVSRVSGRAAAAARGAAGCGTWRCPAVWSDLRPVCGAGAAANVALADTGCVRAEHAYSGTSWGALTLEVGKSPTAIRWRAQLPTV